MAARVACVRDVKCAQNLRCKTRREVPIWKTLMQMYGLHFDRNRMLGFGRIWIYVAAGCLTGSGSLVGWMDRSWNPGRRFSHLHTLPHQLWGPLHLNRQSSRSLALTSDLHLAPRLRLSGGLPLLSLHGGCGTTFTFDLYRNSVT